MQTFTPVASFAGGALIGLAAVVLMALSGRIAGVSGITAGLLSWSRPGRETGWRFAFVAGVVLAPVLIAGAGFLAMPIRFVAATSTMALAGLLVGFGTVLGNGCTSGHGVCGIARLSIRSIVATAVFMAAGVATVYLVRHIGNGS
jgi:uncharacterized membrane protein YedE/YeeE